MSLPYEFDLLGGKGIPPQSGPTTITLAALTVSVPLIVAITLAIVYVDNRIALSVKKGELAKLESVTSTMDQALSRKHAVEEKIKSTKQALAEVQTILDERLPWSPVLATIAESLPISLTLDAFAASFEIIQKQVPSKANPKKKIDIRVPTRKMKIQILADNNDNADLAVREYQNRLHTCPLLQSQLEPITISRESKTWENKDAVFYEMDCAFKTE